MEAKKILKVSYPPITSYMTHAPVLSIISDKDESLPWFLLNYIQIRIWDDGLDFYNFYNSDYCCPFLEVISLTRTYFSKYINIDIIELVINSIEDNYYIIPIIDTYYISLYQTYKKYHLIHPILIFGYDKSNNTFSVADFFNDGVYSFQKISFIELREAYKNCDESDYWMKGIKLLRRKEYNHTFELGDFKNSLERYLNGYEPSINYNHYSHLPRRFGLNHSYEKVFEEIEKFSNFKKFDFRILPFFCDHKKVLKLTIEFLLNHKQQLEHLLSDYDELFNQFMIFRNLLIKCMVKKQNNMLNCKKIFELKSKEINILENTIRLLS